MDYDEINRNWFGPYTNTPEAFIAALEELAKHATARLGVVDGNERTGMWIDGNTLGVLTSRGNHDMNAQIGGRVVYLDQVTYVDLTVDLEYDQVAGKAKSGKVLTVNFPGGTVRIDGSPGACPDEDERQKHNTFIEQVLAILAGRPEAG